MRPAKAIAILSIPFAAVSLASLSGMCLTPYWDCSQVTLTIDLWQPALFLLVAFTVVAVVVLYVDLLLMRGDSQDGELTTARAGRSWRNHCNPTKDHIVRIRWARHKLSCTSH